jgi:8-oxo-dGTP diphosphatase
MAKRQIRVVAAQIERDGKYLITQRKPSSSLPLLWEFPGGRVEDGETDEQALAREVLHRLGVSVEVGQLVSFVRHPYDKYTIELHLYECRLASGQPSKRNVYDFAWVQSDEFEHYPFTPADELSVAKLLGLD